MAWQIPCIYLTSCPLVCASLVGTNQSGKLAVSVHLTEFWRFIGNGKERSFFFCSSSLFWGPIFP